MKTKWKKITVNGNTYNYSYDEQGHLEIKGQILSKDLFAIQEELAKKGLLSTQASKDYLAIQKMLAKKAEKAKACDE